MPDMNIWDKLNKVVLLLLGVAGLLLVCVLYLPLIRQNERMRKEIFKLDVQVQKEAELARNLKASVEASYNDPKTVERLVRENLGYARTNELIIRFEPPSSQPTNPGHR
jgi:hypothetical protein